MRLVSAPQRVVKFLRQQRLGGFGLLSHVAHSGKQVRQRALLLRHLLDELLALGRIIQGLFLAVAHRIQLVHDLILLLRQVARLISQIAHLLGELAGGLLPQIVPQILHRLLRARASGERLRSGVIFHLLRGAFHVRARLIQLLPRLGLRTGVGRLRELLAQFVHVREHLPLLIAQAFELALDVLALLVGARGLQGILQLAQTLVQILLPLGKLLQAVRRLQLLALLGIGRSRRLALGFVAVFLRRHVKLVHLPLLRLAPAAARVSPP